MTTNSRNPVDGDVQALDYFGSIVNQARARAEKAMTKFPQPNYVLNKVAEESGEVIKAVIHYTEGRETWANVEAELIDNLAMLIRLVTEGDQVIGFTPPVEVQLHNATPPAQILRPVELPDEAPNSLVALCQQMYDHKSTGTTVAHDVWQDCLEEMRLNATAQPVSDGWVRCSDGYPSIGEEVLIRIPVCNHHNIENGEYKGEGKFIGAWCDTRGEGCAYTVTHWMPLPAAPGGQD